MNILHQKMTNNIWKYMETCLSQTESIMAENKPSLQRAENKPSLQMANFIYSIIMLTVFNRFIDYLTGSLI